MKKGSGEMNKMQQCVTVLRMCFWTLSTIIGKHNTSQGKPKKPNNHSHDVSDGNDYNYAKITTLLEISRVNIIYSIVFILQLFQTTGQVLPSLTCRVQTNSAAL